jgi:hypothetical protein
MRLKLSEREVHQGNLSGTVSAITEGLAIEKAQYATLRSISDRFEFIYSPQDTPPAAPFVNG